MTAPSAKKLRNSLQISFLLGFSSLFFACVPVAAHHAASESVVHDQNNASSTLPPGCDIEPTTGVLLDAPIGGGSPGTFKLYVDLSRDFNPTLPTVIEILDGQQVQGAKGTAEATKRRFRLNGNVVRVEHRGLPPCSRIEFATPKNSTDWAILAKKFSSQRVIEDIEFTRKTLLGEKKVAVFGSSGGGVLAAQYAARYPQSVERVAMGISSSELSAVYKRSEQKFWQELASIGLEDAVRSLIPSDGQLEGDPMESRNVTSVELLWELVQSRYKDKTLSSQAEELIRSVISGDSSQLLSWKRELEKQSPSPYSLAPLTTSILPFVAVRLFELSRHSQDPRHSPMVRPFLPTIEPLLVADEEGLLEDVAPINLRQQLASLDAEFLLVGARWDHVMPWEEMAEDQKLITRSRIKIFDDTHGLFQYQACMQEAFSAFLNLGLKAEYLDSPSSECPTFFETVRQ